MGTKAIREVLEDVYRTGTAEQVVRAQKAMREVEAIEKAAHAQRQLTVAGWCTADDSRRAEQTWKSIADPDGLVLFPEWSPGRKG